MEWWKIFKLKKGLYDGCNLAYGVVDDIIEIGFKIINRKYQKTIRNRT